MQVAEKPITKTKKPIRHNVKFNKCGCTQEMEFTGDRDNWEEIEPFYQKVFNGINEYCPKCTALNKEYGLEKVIHSGDYDTSSTLYIFNHTDIRKIVHYCYIKGIEIHSEHYDINSPYDCTGQCIGLSVKFKRFKNHITIRHSRSYDL